MYKAVNNLPRVNLSEFYARKKSQFQFSLYIRTNNIKRQYYL